MKNASAVLKVFRENQYGLTLLVLSLGVGLSFLASYLSISPQAPIVLGAGLIISLLLSGIVLALRRSEVRASIMAARWSAQWHEVKERYRLMIENVMDYAIVMLDTEGRVTIWNNGAVRINGHTPGEIIGQHFACFYTPEDIANGKPAEALRVAVAKGHFEDEGWRVRKDGTHFWANVVLTALKDVSGTLIGFSKIMRDLTERKRSEDLVLHLAHHDALTDLPNRALLLDRLGMAIKQAKRAQHAVGVLMVDLDHFKRINDSLGHNVGDQLLLEVTERLMACVRDTDTVARLGGDEFVLVLPDISGGEAAGKVAASILESMSREIRVSGRELHVTPSIGIGLYPNDGEDARTLLKNTDMAMYHAKAAGRNNFQWFDRKLLKTADDKQASQSAQRAFTIQCRLGGAL